MANCAECVHAEVCRFKDLPAPLSDSYIRESECIERRCGDFKDRARFVKLKSAVWCKHNPELSKMKKFHKQGIGLGMSENSVFWTCSNCGVWGSPIYSFCPHCGARIIKEHEENA